MNVQKITLSPIPLFNNGENNLTNERDVEYKFQATIITNHKGIKYQYIYNEDGECVGYGTPAELLKTCEIYREIYFCQFPDAKI